MAPKSKQKTQPAPVALPVRGIQLRSAGGSIGAISAHSLSARSLVRQNGSGCTLHVASDGIRLTPKQQRFVEEFVLDLSATQAAIRAGYSAKTAKEQGYQLLRKTSLAAAIHETLAARSEKVAITAEMVVEGLLLEARRVDEGASHSARVTAWTQLGKHLGMFTEKHDLKHTHAYSELTDEELDGKLTNLLASYQLPVH